MKNQTKIIERKIMESVIDDKKKMGKVYTPSFIADFLSKLIIRYVDPKIIVNIFDPACGMGELLMTLADNTGNDYCHLIGNDINESDMYDLAELLHFKGFNSFDLFSTDGLCPFGNINNDAWKKELAKRGIDNIDVVIANPPWGADICMTETNRKNFSLLVEQFDSSDLFIESMSKLLPEHGMLGIIIPDSLFFYQRSKLRLYLLEKFRIRSVVRLGEKLFPKINRGVAIVVAEKDTITPLLNRNNTIECFSVSSIYKSGILRGDLNLYDLFLKNKINISQDRFLKNDNYQFEINVNFEDLKIKEKIEKKCIKKFGDYLNSFRGVELSKSGKIIQCPKCKKWMPLSIKKSLKCKYCLYEKTDEISFSDVKVIIGNLDSFEHKIVVGEDIHRYSINYSKSLEMGYEGINYKSNEIYKGPKILVRKTGIGVSASLDYSDSYCNQVVYILNRKSNADLPLELFMAILNSRFAFYYLTTKSGETEWRSHPYLTQYDLNNFPFPDKICISEKEMEELVTLVKRMVESNGQDKKADILIECLVARLYSLKAEDYEIIFKHIKAAEHLLVIRNLMSVDERMIINGI